MLQGLVVRVIENQQDLCCPDHPNAILEAGAIAGYRVFRKCPNCANSGQWHTDAERETEIRELANKASARR